MSYVPPQLRNSSSSAAAATTTLTIDSDHGGKLSRSASSNCHTTTSTRNSLSRRPSAAFSSSRTSSVPDVVFPHWIPSDRVLRLNDSQKQARLPPHKGDKANNQNTYIFGVQEIHGQEDTFLDSIGPDHIANREFDQTAIQRTQAKGLAFV